MIEGYLFEEGSDDDYSMMLTDTRHGGSIILTGTRRDSEEEKRRVQISAEKRRKMQKGLLASSKEIKKANRELLAAIKNPGTPLSDISALLDRGAQLDVRNKEGQTPLIIAVVINRPQLVDLLLARIQRQPNPWHYLSIADTPGRSQLSGKTALEWARHLVRKGIVEKLLDAGASD